MSHNTVCIRKVIQSSLYFFQVVSLCKYLHWYISTFQLKNSLLHYIVDSCSQTKIKMWNKLNLNFLDSTAITWYYSHQEQRKFTENSKCFCYMFLISQYVSLNTTFLLLFSVCKYSAANPFLFKILILYPLKTPEILWCMHENIIHKWVNQHILSIVYRNNTG